MVNNVIAVYINGINLTRYVVMPLKWANLLDEQLDEAVISLRNCPKKVITPLTPVEIRITNNVYMGGNSVDNLVYSKPITKYMIVADQPDSNENPVGSGRYDHDISVIEITKLLERIVVDSITYTNVKSKIYTANQYPMPLAVSYENGASESDYTNYYKGQPASLITPIPANETLTLPSWNSQWTLPAVLEAEWTNVTVQVLDANGQIITSANGAMATPSISIAVSGNYTIVYKGQFSSRPGASTIVRQFPTLTFTFAVAENRLPLKKLTITDVITRLLDVAEPIRQGEQPRFSFNAQQAALFANILAPQFSFTKQTLRECLQAIGGVVHGEPRLSVLNDGGGWYYEISYDLYGGTQYSNIETRPYIKETVKQVIEQYCTHIDTSAENLVNAIGESTGAFLSGRNGVITEPYDGGLKTVRCDTMYARIDESNMQIVTQLPIYAIQKLECGIIPNNEGVGTETSTYRDPGFIASGPNASGSYKAVTNGTVISATVASITSLSGETGVTATITSISDNTIYFSLNNTQIGLFSITFSASIFTPLDLTPYVFEASEYNSRLSSYDSAYPYSKAYGLMYTQGQKNITALNFKQDNAISPVFESYSIINILEEITGQSLTDLNEDYPLLAFRVIYTPFYSARVAQTKPNISDFPRGSALVYNQSANVIESRFYGENLKGVIARLGNVEKTKTYTLSRLGLVPQAGQKYDDDYYISAVNVELFTNLIKVTLALSKDFNRLSQYIGISSVKRFSEVSQTQAQERNVLYRDYIVIGDSVTADSDSHIGDNLMQAVIETFTAGLNSQPLTNVVAWGMTAQNNPLPNVVQLPVIGSAFGNSISFEWAYEDNFSAGAVAQYATGGTGGSSVSGYFQNNLQYTDYYGRVYYYNFDLMPSGTIPTTFEEQTDIGTSLPKYDKATPTTSSGYFSTIGLQPEMLRKDNREIIKVNAQVDFVTNRKGMIIGSALAFNNPAVGGLGIQAAKLYVFTDKLDKFINHVSGSIDVPFTTEATQPYVVQTIDLPSAALDISELENGQFNISVQGGVFPGTSGTQYQSWAIVTAQIVSTEQVEDEEGNQTTQTVQYGGDVLIAQNINFSAGDTFSPIYFTKKREVFDKSVWTTAL